MKKTGFTSFYSATLLKGIESIKRSLLLFDDVILPAQKSAIENQIDIFSDKRPAVKKYLNKHLLSLDLFGVNYSSYITELMTYFGKYHFKNWLNPSFEEEVGEFIDQTHAEISWNHSLKLDSVLLAQVISNDLEIPTYFESTEISIIQNPPCVFAKAISETVFDEIFDCLIPDPSNLDWQELVDLLKDKKFISFRENLHLCIENQTVLSKKYLEDMILFFNQNFPKNLNMKVALKGIDAGIGSIIPIYGPGKALYDIYKIDNTYKRYYWLSIVHKVIEQAQQSEKDTE